MSHDISSLIFSKLLFKCPLATKVNNLMCFELENKCCLTNWMTENIHSLMCFGYIMPLNTVVINQE